MSLFVNTTHLNYHPIDHNDTNVSETIEYDCLSVLHKLHDQVNGPQLVQVVVQPLARLFNPTAINNIAATNKNAISDNFSSGTNSSSTAATTTTAISSNAMTFSSSNNTSPSLQQATPNLTSSQHQLSSNPLARNSLSSSATTTTTTTSTYMMSPDTVQALIARLDTDRDINWLMEIIGYGLSMPFSITSEQDSVKDCCTIYLEWLSASLLPLTNEQTDQSKIRQLVPVPIRNDPNRYARKMLSHLYNVFLPRQSTHMPATTTMSGNNNFQKEQNDRELAALSRQAVLCHRVLRTLENIAQNPTNLMDNETWDHLLALLLTINNKLLSQPSQAPDIGSQLQERILGVLFDLILLASCKSIPMQNIWRTFHLMCLNWRHRPALVDHWRRVTLLLTKRIIRMPNNNISNNNCQIANRGGASGGTMQNRSSIISIDHTSNNNSFTIGIETAISTMSHDTLSQTWYRFLNLIGNPVDLTNPHIISKTNEFYDFACASENVMDPSQHPCLNVLSGMFTNSMLAVRDFVETFIGFYEDPLDDSTSAITDYNNAYNFSERHSNRGSITSISSTITPPINSSNNSSSMLISGSNNNNNQQQQQQQATTPLQARRVIKSITMKGSKVNPFNTSPSQQQQSQSSQSEQHSGHSDNSGNRNANQFMEPRNSLTSLPGRTLGFQQQQQQQHQMPPVFRLSPDRPKINSILHLFGDWLFSAALLGSELKHSVDRNNDMNYDNADNLSTTDNPSIITESSGQFLQQANSANQSNKGSFSLTSISSNKDQQQQQQMKATQQHGELYDDKTNPNSSLENYEDGQAEAITILCRIFSAKTSAEDVSPNYLSRFYLCLQHCLSLPTKDDSFSPDESSINMTKAAKSNQTTSTRTSNNDAMQVKRHLLASVLINSTSLLQKDLDGINLLIPSFITAIEYFFECSETRELPVQPPPRAHSKTNQLRPTLQSTSNSNSYNNNTGFNNNELRRACIQTLINLLAYPYHFQNLAIRNCLNDSSPTTTFGSLRPKLIKLLFIALQTESDPTNMQILFSGLSLAIYDLASNATENSPKQSQTDQKQASSTTASRIRSSSSSTHGDMQSLHSFDGAANTTSQNNNQQQQQSLSKGAKSDTDSSSQSSFIGSSPGAFLIKSVHVTCHLLINIWKNDTQVSLAALDLLTMIARVTAIAKLIDFSEANNTTTASKSGTSPRSSMRLNNNNHQIEMRNEYNQATKWICDYICSQCSRPPPAHSRDMHSTIVAAYQCLSIWISNHPYLLEDLNCVNTLMDVIELGVSGQKSKSFSYEPTSDKECPNVILKGVKILKPSSMRVREAAESLLNICMIRSRLLDLGDPFDLTYDSVLDELDVMEMFGDPKIRDKLSDYSINDGYRRLETCKHFKYFSDEDSILYGFFERIGPNEPNLRDSVICLLRTPFGRYCYKFKFNCHASDQSREKILSANRSMGLIKRPLQNTTQTQTTTTTMAKAKAPLSGNILPDHQNPWIFQNKSLYFNTNARFFPETIDQTQASELDLLVDTLDDYYKNCDIGKQHQSTGKGFMNLRNDLDKITNIFHHQILAEQNVMSDAMSFCPLPNECLEPQASGDLSATRMLAIQMGLETCLDPICDDNRALNSSMSFINELESLDKQAIKMCEHASIFYVRKNRTSLKEILESVRERRNISLEFFEWLLELGKPILVRNHSRWTGKLSSSHKSRPFLSNNFHNNNNDNIVKTTTTSTTHDDVSLAQLLNSDHGGSIFDGERLTLYWSDMCQELAFLLPHQLDDHHQKVQQQQQQQQKLINNTDIIICWLESGDDLNDIPSDILLSVTRHGIFASDLQSQTASSFNNTEFKTSDQKSASPPKTATQTQNSNDLSSTNQLSQQQLFEQNSNDTAVSTPIINSHNQQQKATSTSTRSRDYAKFFITPMRNGLYRVNLQTSFGRQNLALPLIDGMTISRGTLSSLIRESILNFCRRRRLDSDNYQPAHVRRRQKIQKICNSFKISNQNQPVQYYDNLFNPR